MACVFFDFHMSFMYVVNSFGSSREPCCTPVSIAMVVEFVPFTVTMNSPPVIISD